MDKHLDPGIAGDYAEGILDPAARAAADAHLRGCEDCRREVAAAAAYFRDMSSLEPIKAPADFLANVRARLTGESPWRRALSAVLRPLRVVPVQLALATLIGVTAVTVYVQKGGLERESVTVMEEARPSAPASPAMQTAPTQAAPADKLLSEPQPEPPAKHMQEKGARADDRKERQRTLSKDFAAKPAKVAEETDRLSGSSAGGAGAVPSSRPISNSQPLNGISTGPVPGSALADIDLPQTVEKKSAKHEGEAASPSRRDAPRPATRAMSDEDAESLDMPMSESAPARASDLPSAPAAIGRAREAGPKPVSPARPEPSAKAEAAPKPVKPASAPKAKNRSAPAEVPMEEAGNEYGGALGWADDGNARTAKENGDARAESRAKPAGASAKPTTLTLRMRALKDTTAVLSGLKAMGISVEPPKPASADGRRKLSAAPSMMPDLRAYLSRYGTLEVTAGDSTRPELIFLAP